MSKALVIKGANFSVNALTTITFEETVDCTGISLNKATSTITSIGGTDTLAATTTPADTTDQIIWSSSDDTVATVTNGVVTANGLGSATITVSCGSYSASCNVSVAVVLNEIDDVVQVVGGYLAGTSISSGGNGLPTIQSVASRGAFVKTSGTLHYYKQLNGVDYYPVPLPPNTRRIKLTYLDTPYNNTYVGVVQLFNAETAADGYPNVVKLITTISANEFSPDAGQKSKIVDIPSVDGQPEINAIAVCVRHESADFYAEDFDKCVFEFLPAAE